MNCRRFVCLALLVAALLAVPAGAGADSTVWWREHSIGIDGTIELSEITGARKISVTGTPSYDVYLLSNENYLYLAFAVTGDTTASPHDAIRLFFEKNNSNSYPAVCDGSDEGAYLYDVTDGDFFVPYSIGGGCTPVAGGTYLSAASSMAAGYRTYEMLVYVNDGPLVPEPGDTIGFALSVYDEQLTADTAGVTQFYPTTASATNPATWNDLLFASQPPAIYLAFANLPPVIDGVVDADEWAAANPLELEDPGVVNATVYLMADGQFLYGAVVSSDASFAVNDSVSLMFDNDYNGAWPASCGSEGNYSFYYDSAALVAGYAARITDGADCGWTTAQYAYIAGSTQTDNHVEYEFVVNLHGDEMDGGTEDLVGAALSILDTDTDRLSWPEEQDYRYPETFGVLVFPTWDNSEFSTSWAEDMPAIDGTVDAAEWADAEMIPVYGLPEVHAYFLSDGDYLYLGLDAVGDGTLEDGDSFLLFFDNDHDGAWPTSCQTDGYLAVIYKDAGNEYWFHPLADGIGCSEVAADSVFAIFGETSDGNVQAEIAFDWSDNEIYGAPGETIGVHLQYWDETSDEQMDWPALDILLVGNYAAMTYAECGGCLIASVCYDDGEANPLNECEWCDTATSTTMWSDHDGIACTDNGFFCDGVEACDGGECASPGDPCDEDEECNENTDTCEQTDDDTVDDDTADDDTADDDTTDDDTVDDDTTDDDTVDDDLVDDDTTDDDSDDDDDGGGGLPPTDDDSGDSLTGRSEDDGGGCGC